MLEKISLQANFAEPKTIRQEQGQGLQLHKRRECKQVGRQNNQRILVKKPVMTSARPRLHAHIALHIQILQRCQSVESPSLDACDCIVVHVPAPQSSHINARQNASQTNIQLGKVAQVGEEPCLDEIDLVTIQRPVTHPQGFSWLQTLPVTDTRTSSAVKSGQQTLHQ
jgi:hypothetical protein